MTKKYKCVDDTMQDEPCGWVGTEDEMEADFATGSGEEWWSNWICPKCRVWQDLQDYEEIP